MKRVALIGNQNCGKTTFFNEITGSSLHVGNFPGTTVTLKEGICKYQPSLSFLDLPGIYSLTSYTDEEIITIETLLNGNIDIILNLVHATNLVRSLYLTIQCLELQIPMILAVNMIDELTQNKGYIQLDRLSSFLKIPCIPINAQKGQGMHECIQALLFSSRPAQILSIYPFSFQTQLTLLMKNESLTFFQAIHQLEESEYEVITQARYHFILKISELTVHMPQLTQRNRRTLAIDRWLLSPFGGYFFLFFFLACFFICTFVYIGPFFNHFFTHFSEFIIVGLNLYLKPLLHPILFSLIVDGLFKGCMSVFSFLPIILSLFFFLSMLEDSGYLTRMILLMDSFFKKIGLSGKSVVPLLLGLGCSVPAILASRILQNKKEKKRTIFLIPFMSCSAKLPIYIVFTTLFFPTHALFLIFLLYAWGILMGLLISTMIHHLLPPTENSIILEIPDYRFPSIKNTFHLLQQKTKDFIQKVFSIILLLNLFLWFFQHFTIHLIFTNDISQSLLYLFTNSISWIFMPLGFHDWRITTALMSGLSAKEAIVSTFSVLFDTSSLSLATHLQTLFTPASAFSFLLFILFYTPCIATLTFTYKEAGLITTLFMILFQMILAWFIAFLFYSIVSFI